MNRRDTILIAVFVNTGVLGLLFLMGVNSEELDSTKVETVQIAQVSPLPKLEIAEATPIVIPKVYEEPPEIEEEPDFDFDGEVFNQKPSDPEPALFPNGFFEVKVKRGDFLEKIARANGTTVEEIKNVNRLSSEKIAVGQILRIPNKTSKKAEPVAEVTKVTQAPVTASKTTSEAEAVYYVVKSGDNPWKIAKQFNIRVDQLLKLNNLNETKAKNLKVGDRLRVK